MDPAPLPKFNVAFGPKSIYQSQAEASFLNGNATGLNRLRRASNCQGPKLFAGQYSINCTLSIYPLETNYDVQVRNGSNFYKARNMGRVSETLIDVKIAGQVAGHLKSFQITRLGVVNPTFIGLPNNLLKYVQVLSDKYKTAVPTNLYNTIQNGVKYALDRALANKPMPRQ